MENTMKFLVLHFLILNSCIAMIEHLANIGNRSLDSFDIDERSVRSKLNQIKQERLNCFYRQGVSDDSFESCCGEGYSRLENIFVNQYRILQKQLENSFNRRIAYACVKNHEPCIELATELSDSIKHDRDLYQSLYTKKKEMEDADKIDQDTLEIAFAKFKQNHKALVNARILISNAMFKTVEKIQKFINDSKLELKHDYMDFKPHFVYNINKEEETTINDKHLGALKTNNRDFNTSLLAESHANKLIGFYIGNGLVREDDLDKTKMPSEQLADINKIVKEKNQKLKF